MDRSDPPALSLALRKGTDMEKQELLSASMVVLDIAVTSMLQTLAEAQPNTARQIRDQMLVHCANNLTLPVEVHAGVERLVRLMEAKFPP